MRHNKKSAKIQSRNYNLRTIRKKNANNWLTSHLTFDEFYDILNNIKKTFPNNFLKNIIFSKNNLV